MAIWIFAIECQSISFVELWNFVVTDCEFFDDNDKENIIKIMMMDFIFYSGTDWSNIVQKADMNDNFPMPFERSTMWNNANIRWLYHGKTDVSAENLSVTMASAWYYM